MNDVSTSESLPVDEKRAAYKFKYICKSKVKQLALEIAKSNPAPSRAKMFTRVSEDFLMACEAHLKNFIHDRVSKHPSRGKTLT